MQPAERNVLDQWEDVALESGEVDELAVPFVPLPCLPFARDVRLGAARGCSLAGRGVTTGCSLPLDRGQAGPLERLLVLLALMDGKAVVTAG